MHGNHPNNSERFRAVQYIRQIPNSGDHPYGPMIKNKKDLLPKDLTLTPLGSRLFGLVPWGNDLRKQTEWMNVVEPWKGNKNQVNQKQSEKRRKKKKKNKWKKIKRNKNKKRKQNNKREIF